MTIEERAQTVIAEIGRYSESSEIRALIEQALRDQIEECAEIADKEVAERGDGLRKAAHHNRPYDFRGHSDAITASETIAKNIRALSGIPNDDGPDDRFDLGGFECNEKQED